MTSEARARKMGYVMAADSIQVTIDNITERMPLVAALSSVLGDDSTATLSNDAATTAIEVLSKARDVILATGPSGTTTMFRELQEHVKNNP